jgi:hypothetical protein
MGSNPNLTSDSHEFDPSDAPEITHTRLPVRSGLSPDQPAQESPVGALFRICFTVIQGIQFQHLGLRCGALPDKPPEKPEFHRAWAGPFKGDHLPEEPGLERLILLVIIGEYPEILVSQPYE